MGRAGSEVVFWFLGWALLRYDRRGVLKLSSTPLISPLAHRAQAPVPLLRHSGRHCISEPEKSGLGKGITGLGHSFLEGHWAHGLSSSLGNPILEENISRTALDLTCWAESTDGSQLRAATPGSRHPGGCTGPSAPPSYPGCRLREGEPGGSDSSAPPCGLLVY